MKVGSLFSGIGGLDLGLERAGMEVRWQSEIDPYASRVLAKHWPSTPNLGDVTEIEWEKVERVDLVCGGFPCQPWSVAGRRLGTADDRWLWPEFVRCIRGVRPGYVLVENVPGLLVGGMGHVLGDLAELGFDAEWESIPAAAVGAPHLRYRVFVLAYPAGDAWRFGNRDGALDVADPDASGRDGRAWIFGTPGRGQLADGGQWLVEPDVGRVADGVPSRVDRLRALGNAVVPQVAEYVGRQLLPAINQPSEIV